MAMDIRQALTGPIPSIHTPFKRDGELDLDGLRNQIDTVIAAGARTILLTAGDSHYLALSDEEIDTVTSVTAGHTAGRAMVVAADRHFDTRQAVSFAGRCRELGADVLMLMPPDWAGSCTPRTLATHYAAVAAHIPVMLVTNIFIPRGEAFGLETIKATLATKADIVAIKDDMGGAFAQKLRSSVGESLALFAGGQKRNHMLMHPFGVDGYLSTFLLFNPAIAHRYWQAICDHDMAEARRIITELDMPLFDRLLRSPGGFDAAIHGILEIAGICKRWRRPPYYSLTDEELDALKSDLQSLALLD